MVNHRRDRRIAGIIIDVFDAEVVEWDESAGSRFREAPQGQVDVTAAAATAAVTWEEVPLPGVRETLATWKKGVALGTDPRAEEGAAGGEAQVAL
jgi:hypothetical protein